MGVYFIDRKNGKQFDSSFSMPDSDLSSWHVGDEVTICFPGNREKVDAAIEHTGKHFETGELLMIKCIVVSRARSIVWKSIGRFEEICPCSVMLQAADGMAEDLLVWVLFDKKPDWA